MNYGKALNQYAYTRSFGTLIPDVGYSGGYVRELLNQYHKVDLPKVLEKLPKTFADHYQEESLYHDYYLDSINISGDFRDMTLTLNDRRPQGNTEFYQDTIVFHGVYPLHVESDENDNLVVKGASHNKQIFGMTIELSKKQRNHFYCHLLMCSGRSITWEFTKLDFHTELLPVIKKKPAKTKK